MKKGEKSIYFIMILSFLVVFLFSVFEVYTVSKYNRKIEKIYVHSINYTCNYWADQFFVVNKELKRMIDKDDQADFQMICNAQPQTSIDTAAANLQNDLTNMAVINENQIVFFVYFPDRELMLTSISYIGYFHDNEMGELKAYLKQTSGGNTAEWKDVKFGQNDYFLHLYEKSGAFSGCFISCENVLDDIMPEEQSGNEYILNMDGSVFYASSRNEAQNADYFSYSRSVRMINKKICIKMPYNSFADSAPYFIAIFISAIVASVLLILLALKHQERTIFRPLLKLKVAMEEFSGGKTDVVLDEQHGKNEIEVLYRTFNRMREQIVNLKIDVYAGQIERQQIYTNFLRVQIQPHFYTNILNLIYTLANAGDCQTIRKMTKNMADYFRYILSLNKNLVSLEAELQCIDHYTQVQRIRYQDHFLLRVTCNTNPKAVKIPPLLIQTFVENSIEHNIMIVQDLLVLLDIDDEGENLRICEQDNGVGISADIIEKLENGEDIEEDGKHIGIVNVINRLHVLYHGKASIKISGGKDGSRVVILIPQNGETEEEKL
jgi:sensor histidine kinase YesM